MYVWRIDSAHTTHTSIVLSFIEKSPGHYAQIISIVEKTAAKTKKSAKNMHKWEKLEKNEEGSKDFILILYNYSRRSYYSLQQMDQVTSCKLKSAVGLYPGERR